MTKFAGTSFTRESDGADAFEGGGAGGTTNLSILNRNATTLDIASSSGADATVPAATTSLAGVMTATDKAKLDGIGSGANVASVAGKTGAVALAPADIVGLGEFIDDEIAGLLVAGANITLTYDDVANTLTIASTGGGGGGGGVTSVSGTGTVSGLTLTGTVTSTGNLTLGGALSVVPGNFASQTANTFLAAPNGAAGAPTFRSIVAADIPTLNQSTTGSAATLTTSRNFSISGGGITASAVGFNGSAAVTLSASVDAGHITLARMANLAANSFIGNNTGAAATPIAMTGTQATALLDNFTSSAKGLAPASGGGTTNFLRADGTWAVPAGGTGTDISYTASTRAVASSTGTGFTFPLLSSTDAGLAPASGGGTANFLRADGTWAAPAGGGGLTNNWTATSAPTASNDNTQGYAVGSQWLWAARGQAWVCVSAATGAAVWQPVNTNLYATPRRATGPLLHSEFYHFMPGFRTSGSQTTGATFFYNENGSAMSTVYYVGSPNIEAQIGVVTVTTAANASLQRPTIAINNNRSAITLGNGITHGVSGRIKIRPTDFSGAPSATNDYSIHIRFGEDNSDRTPSTMLDLAYYFNGTAVVFEARSRLSGGAITTTSLTVPTANVYSVWAIEVSGGTCNFYVNGVLVASRTGLASTYHGRPMFLMNQTTATVVNGCDIDWLEYYVLGLS